MASGHWRLRNPRTVQEDWWMWSGGVSWLWPPIPALPLPWSVTLNSSCFHRFELQHQLEHFAQLSQISVGN